MKCCSCNKEIDKNVSLKDGHAQWYGRYKNNVCIKVICHDCIKDPEKKKKYSKG